MEQAVSEPVSNSIVLELRRGSRAAFQAVYAAERKRLFGFLVRLSRDPHVAADLFQNTWLKLARCAGSLHEQTDLRAWLFTVARNEYRSYCRAQVLDASRLLVLGREHDAHVATPVEGPRVAAIDAALRRLSDGDREVILLVAVEGFEPQRAAGILGISYAALRQRLARARQRFAALLEADAPLDRAALPESS